MLSRKKNMIFASRALCKGMKITAHVRRNTPEVVYLDVGEGLTGTLHTRNINVEGKICRDDIIEVKILNASNNRRYTLAYDNMDLKKYVGRILEGTVTGKIGDSYFVEFPNHVNGILQVDPVTPPLANGTTVKCFLRAYTP